VFCNGGDSKYFLSSADMMSRNLDHRSEVAVPVYDLKLQSILLQYMLLQFSDNVKSRVLDQDMSNRYKKTAHNKSIRSQEEFFKVLKSFNK
jgi:polyphosphate kinase